MKKYHIELTAEETALLSKIDLQVTHRSHDEGHAAYNANKVPILALVQSLSNRQAVPHERRNYWNVPDYNPGRVQASRKGVFERNGTLGEDIYGHPHFIPYLATSCSGRNFPTK